MPFNTIHQILRYAVIEFVLAGANDYCSSDVYSTLSDLAKRSPSYSEDAVPLCDRYLPFGWYRAGFHQIPTTPPAFLSCGTTYPYWMNGTTPETFEENKTVQMCQVGFTGACERSHNMLMANCGDFFVYKLSPLPICSSAYCFEQIDSCVADVPQNIEVRYHGVSWTSTFVARTDHDPDVNLACHFDRLSDLSLYYDVTWYVDNTEVLTNQTVSSNSSDIPLLSGTQMLAKDKKANSMIHCVVGAKQTAEDTACNTSSSPLFFAGIKVLPSTLQIPRGGDGEVEFQFTIPFVNRHTISGGRVFQTPLYINMAVHGGSVDCDDPDKIMCHVTVNAYKIDESYKYDTDDWKAKHKVKVYNRDDGDFTLIDKHITLRFETGPTDGVGSKIFEGITLPDVQVYIEDTTSSWKGVNCESHTDPHMKTFDGKDYECQLDGTFILYRNEHFQQEVQEKHHLCHPSYPYPRCSCAVAVRSGKDVFIVDICNSRTIINFASCGDKVLKVIKVNDRNYKVILPTGTLVEIKFVSWPVHDQWQLNVDIYPSPSDVGNSSGLCGILDGDDRNDFTRNDAEKTVDKPDLINYYNPPDNFSKSWRVNENEFNLFDHTVYSNLKSISTVLDRVCTCKKNNEIDPPGDIECSYGTFKNCKFRVGKQYHCILNPEGQLRRKRDLSHMQSLISDGTTSYENEHNILEKRQKRETTHNVKTHVEAEQICTTAFLNSQSYRTCQSYVSDLSNTSLVNCISDVMMTGDDNFTKIHIEAALEQCSVFVVFNTTFQQTEPDVTYIIESFCQNNCSGHGVCNGGNCTCEPNFAGSDCSFDLLGPPSITHISDFGLCDKSKETCDEITLYGKYFVENMNTKCFMTRKMLRRNGTTISTAEYDAFLEERTLFEGYCPLQYGSEDHWVTMFIFNISNDGSRYTENLNVYTYQSLCQEYQNNSGNITFSFKEGHCYIKNTCYADGTTNTENKCDVCNTTLTKHEWSSNQDHCFIDGVCYTSGDINGTDPCSICIPTINTTTWSPALGCKGTTTYEPVTERTPITVSTTSTIESTTKTSEPTTTTEQTSTTDKTTTTTEPTTTTTAQTTTTTVPTTTITEPTTTTTNEPTTTTEPTKTTAPTSTTTEPTTTTATEPTTFTKPTTTTTEPTATITEPSTTAASTTTAIPATTTTQPATPTSVPRTTTYVPTTTTTTTEPTTTTASTTTTNKPKTTTTEPITTTTASNTTTVPTTTAPEPTLTTTEPTTTTFDSTTTTPDVTTTYVKKRTTTLPTITTTAVELQTSCLGAPEDVRVVYHNVTWKKTIETANRTVHEPSIHLKCNFTQFSDSSVYYKIEWFADGNLLIKSHIVSVSLFDRSILPLRDIVDLKKTAGVKVLCRVGATRKETIDPCDKRDSPLFLAGIKINDTNFKLPRKGNAKIGFQLTVPYVTKTVEIDGQMQIPSPLEVHSVLPSGTTGCKDAIGVDTCVLFISAFPYNENETYSSLMWKKLRVINIYHRDTYRYETDPTYMMQLKTIKSEDDFWNDISHGDVTISIEEENNIWKGKSCGSKTDPHMYSFDGVSYEIHITGEFVLYRNTLFNQEVQTKHRLCHSSYSFPHCTCAVSLRSGQDLFLVDVCGEREFIDFVSCKDDVLKVHKIHDKVYKVYFPTGTHVDVSLVEWPVRGAWQIDIDIYPSLVDVNNTEGLCGTLDGDQDNEFTRRDGRKDSVSLVYPNSFSESWKVQTGESLLTMPISNLQRISSSLPQICSCEPDGNQCTFQTFASCLMAKEKPLQCIKASEQVQLSRTKRDVSQQSLALVSQSRILKTMERERRQININVQTREEAENICKSAFGGSPPYKTCEEYVSDFSNSSYSNCIKDVAMTGDSSITSIHVESALQQCVTFVGVNSTLQQRNPVVTSNLQSLCPGNCSKHGLCTNGKCTCDKRYGGSDCSFDTLSAPDIWSNFPASICDKSTQSCARIYFKGRYFLENTEMICIIRRTLISNDESALSSTLLERKLVADNLFQGSCPLPHVHVATWVTKFTVNVSFDGQGLTEAFQLYIYLSECQQYFVDSDFKFSLKDGFCFINNTCVTEGVVNTQNPCELCKPSDNKFDWTTKESCLSTLNPLPPETSASRVDFILIVSVLSCILVIVVIIIFTIKIYMYQKFNKKEELYGRELSGDYRRDFTDKSWTKYFDNQDISELYIPRAQRNTTKSSWSSEGHRYHYT